MASEVPELQTHLRGVRVITESFLDNKFPSDDTQAPKFISVLCRMISNETSCLTFIEETKFLTKVHNQLQSDISEEALAFQMNLLSHIYIKIPTDQLSSAKSCLEALLRKPLQALLWEKPSVRHAWIQSLLKVMKGRTKESLAMVSSEDFLVTLIKCYDDSSIFVRKVAVSFAAELLWQLLVTERHPKAVIQDPILKLTERIFTLSPISTAHKQNIMSVREVLDTLNKLAVESSDVLTKFLFVNDVRQKLLLTLKSVALASDTGSVKALASALALPFWRNDKDLLNLAQELFKTDHAPLTSLIILKSVCSKEEMNSARELMSIPLKLSSHSSDSYDWLLSFMKNNKRKADQLILHSLDLHKSLNPTVADFILLTDLLTARGNPLISCRVLQVLSGFMAKLKGLTLPITSLLCVCLNLIKEVGCHLRVFTDVLQCILGALIVRNTVDILSAEIPSDGSSGGIFKEVFSDVVQRKLCDPEWEIRDTCVEFLCSLISQLRGDQDVFNWITASNLHVQAVQCLNDGERYVRASAIKTLTAVVKWNALWIHFQGCKSDAVDQVINIVNTDSEAFPRRTAAECLSVLYFIDSSAAAVHIIPVMKTAINDFDWQVKLSTLEFWKKYWQDLKRDDAVEHFTQIVGSVLLSGIFDCDRSVQSCACSITLDIYYDYITSSSSSTLVEVFDPQKEWKLDEFSAVLVPLDLKRRLAEASKSIDEYEGNPSSLITDLITSLNPSETDEDGDRFMIDCY